MTAGALDLNLRRYMRPLGGGTHLTVWVALALLILLGYLRYDNFLSAYNISSFLGYNSMFVLISVGMCLVIMTGGIDLSVGTVAALSSVVAAFYYIRIVKVMYFDEAAEPLDRLADRGIGVVMAISAVLIVTFFAYPAFLLGLAETAAAALFAS